MTSVISIAQFEALNEINKRKIVQMSLVISDPIELELLINIVGEYTDIYELDIKIKYSDVASSNLLHSLCSKIENNKNLTSLLLTETHIGETLASLFASVIKNNKYLKSLNLFDCEIEENGGKLIANALKFNNSLKLLCLGTNLLKDSGCDLAKSISEENHTLSDVDVMLNDLRAEGGKAFASCISQSSTLRNLILHRNEISDDAGVCLANALKFNNSLSFLGLGHNLFETNAALAFANALEVNTSLQYLDLHDNLFNEDEDDNDVDYIRIVEAFAKALNVNKSIIHLDGVSNDIINSYLEYNSSLHLVVLKLSSLSDTFVILDHHEYLTISPYAVTFYDDIPYNDTPTMTSEDTNQFFLHQEQATLKSSNNIKSLKIDDVDYSNFDEFESLIQQLKLFPALKSLTLRRMNIKNL